VSPPSPPNWPLRLDHPGELRVEQRGPAPGFSAVKSDKFYNEFLFNHLNRHQPADNSTNDPATESTNNFHHPSTPCAEEVKATLPTGHPGDQRESYRSEGWGELKAGRREKFQFLFDLLIFLAQIVCLAQVFARRNLLSSDPAPVPSRHYTIKGQAVYGAKRE